MRNTINTITEEKHLREEQCSPPQNFKSNYQSCRLLIFGKLENRICTYKESSDSFFKAKHCRFTIFKGYISDVRKGFECTSSKNYDKPLTWKSEISKIMSGLSRTCSSCSSLPTSFSRLQICFYLSLICHLSSILRNESLNHSDHLFLKNNLHLFLFLLFVVSSFQDCNLLSRIWGSSGILFLCTSCFFDVDFNWKGMAYLLRVDYKQN